MTSILKIFIQVNQLKIFKENDIPHVEFEIKTYPSGDRYEGEFKNDKRNGKGI